MGKIIQPYRVRNKVLRRVNEEVNSLKTIKRWSANCMGHVRGRNCLIKQLTERKIEGWREVGGRRGRRSKELLYGIKETRGYWKWKKGSPRLHCVEKSLWTRRKIGNM